MKRTYIYRSQIILLFLVILSGCSDKSIGKNFPSLHQSIDGSNSYLLITNELAIAKGGIYEPTSLVKVSRLRQEPEYAWQVDVVIETTILESISMIAYIRVHDEIMLIGVRTDSLSVADCDSKVFYGMNDQEIPLHNYRYVILVPQDRTLSSFTLRCFDELDSFQAHLDDQISYYSKKEGAYIQGLTQLDDGFWTAVRNMEAQGQER